MQAPATQLMPEPHAWPHWPQFASSVCRSAQWLPHSSVDPAQVHWLFTQTWPPVHEVSQAPQ